MSDLIGYMETAFIDMFNSIENAVIEFWDVLYDDVAKLIDDIEDEFV